MMNLVKKTIWLAILLLGCFMLYNYAFSADREVLGQELKGQREIKQKIKGMEYEIIDWMNDNLLIVVRNMKKTLKNETLPVSEVKSAHDKRSKQKKEKEILAYIKKVQQLNSQLEKYEVKHSPGEGPGGGGGNRGGSGSGGGNNQAPPPSSNVGDGDGLSGVFGGGGSSPRDNQGFTPGGGQGGAEGEGSFTFSVGHNRGNGLSIEDFGDDFEIDLSEFYIGGEEFLPRDSFADGYDYDYGEETTTRVPDESTTTATAGGGGGRIGDAGGDTGDSGDQPQGGGRR